jgi:hypothetical protein
MRGEPALTSGEAAPGNYDQTHCCDHPNVSSGHDVSLLFGPSPTGRSEGCGLGLLPYVPPGRLIARRASGQRAASGGQPLGVKDGRVRLNERKRLARKRPGQGQGWRGDAQPKATETLREMVQADIEAWLKQYVDARESGDPAFGDEGVGHRA